MKRFPIFLAAAWLLLIAALLSGQLMDALHATLMLFTEGTSWGKSFLFLFFMAALLSARHFLQRERDNGMFLYSALVLVAIGFAFGTLVQLNFMAGNGMSVNSFASHVGGCNGATCWEATFFQHNHLTKSVVYFAEKSTGVRIGSSMDNGKPMYDMLPNADAISLVLLLVITAAFLLLAYSVIIEKDGVKALLLAAASFLLLIALFDGGAFTVTGINAYALLTAYFLRGTRVNALLKFALPVFIAAFVAFLPNLLMGSYMIFRDWLQPVALVSALFAFCESTKAKQKIAFGIISLLALSSFAGLAASKYYGAPSDVFVGGQGMMPTQTLFIFGLPENMSAADVQALLPELRFDSVAKYGWYMAGSVSASTLANTNDVGRALKSRLHAPGYLYAFAESGPLNYAYLTVKFMKRPERLQLSPFSLKVISEETEGNTVQIEGISSASPFHLGLQLGSYIRAQGGDALVIATGRQGRAAAYVQ